MEEGSSESDARVSNGDNAGLQGLDQQQRAAWGLAFFGTDESRVTEDVGLGATLGLPGNGCFTEARTTVDPSWREREATLLQLSLLMGESLRRSEQDPTVQEALSQWQRCMADRGQPVANMEDASAKAFAEGEAVASVIADCGASSRLEEAWRAADVAAQRALLRENPEIQEAAQGIIR